MKKMQLTQMPLQMKIKTGNFISRDLLFTLKLSDVLCYRIFGFVSALSPLHLLSHASSHFLLYLHEARVFHVHFT